MRRIAFVPRGTAPPSLSTPPAEEEEERAESETSSDLDFLGTHISDEEDDRARRPLRGGDPERQPKYTPAHEEVVLDAQGRRRFHGAFTGGFSAGYYNTVGSEEGWAPSEWRSSRGDRGGARAQRPEDFMDEEDLQEHRGEQRLVARAGYLPARDPEHAQGAPGCAGMGDRLGELLSLSGQAESVGLQMLRRMGWRDGFGVGPRRRTPLGPVRAKKVYGCAPGPCATSSEGQPDPGEFGARVTSRADDEDASEAAKAAAEAGLDFTFAPRAVSALAFRPKNNLHGVGYEAMRDAPEFAEAAVAAVGKAGFARARAPAKALRSTLPLGYDDDCEGDGGNTIGFWGTGGLGQVGEDMSQYDLALDGPDDAEVDDAGAGGMGVLDRPPALARPTARDARAAGASGRFPLRGFVLAQRPPASEPWFDGPSVPASFRERHTFPAPETMALPEAVQMAIRRAIKPDDAAPHGAADAADSGGAAIGIGGLADNAVHSASQVAADAAALMSADLSGVWRLVDRKDIVRVWQQLQAMRAPPPQQQQQPPPSGLAKGPLGFNSASGAAAAGAAAATAHMMRRAGDVVLPRQKHAVGVRGASDRAACDGPEPPSGGWILPEGCRPYAADAQKQARFENFLAASARGGVRGGSCADHEELDEFRQVAVFFSKPKHAVISERFTSSEMQVAMPPAGIMRSGGVSFKATVPTGVAPAPTDAPAPVSDEAAAAAAGLFGKLTRRSELWAPEPLLCKRFNVPLPPVTRERASGGASNATGFGSARKSWEQTMTFNDSMLPLPQPDAPTATAVNASRPAPPPPPPPRQHTFGRPAPASVPGEQQRRAREATDALLEELNGGGLPAHSGGDIMASAAAPAHVRCAQRPPPPPLPPPPRELNPQYTTSTFVDDTKAAVAPPEPDDVVTERGPPLDLFRAIFADSDDEGGSDTAADASADVVHPPSAVVVSAGKSGDVDRGGDFAASTSGEPTGPAPMSAATFATSAALGRAESVLHPARPRQLATEDISRADDASSTYSDESDSACNAKVEVKHEAGHHSRKSAKRSRKSEKKERKVKRKHKRHRHEYRHKDAKKRHKNDRHS